MSSERPTIAAPSRVPPTPRPALRDTLVIGVVGALVLGVVAQSREAHRTARAAIARCGR